MDIKGFKAKDGTIHQYDYTSLANVPEKEESNGADLGITGAKVGQTVEIIEVDEKGVPTKWKSVDFPDSGGNVDLTGYATEQWVKDQNYLTEVPDGYAKTEDIPEAYTLPVANTATLGGVKPTVAKNEAMTQPVAIDENGGMWTTAAATGTVLVAASDAPDAIKAAAQYVCTGVNDQLMINAAIETVGEGEVRLSGGNFYLTGGIIPKDRIILYGRNSVLNVCDEISSTVTQAYTGGDTVIHVADASKFVIGQKVSTDANLHQSYLCFIVDIDTANNTVTLDAPLHATKGFEANTYKLVADFSVVHCYGLSNVTIEGLVINGNGDSYGFYDTSYGSNGIHFVSGCTECKAINCTINNVKCHGILVSRSGQCQVLNCVVDNCKRLGMDIFGEPGGHLIHGCVAKNCTATGIQGHNVVNTIFSNCIATNCGIGISAQEGPNNVVITGCELYSNRNAIKCIAVSAKTINIVGNTIIGSALDAIQLDAENSTDWVIAHNIIKESAKQAINVIGIKGFSIVGNHISNCYATDTASAITNNAAIKISGVASNGYVADNHIILTTTETKGCVCGIAEYSLTGDNNVVVNNVIRGARIAATQKLGTNSKFENNYEF